MGPLDESNEQGGEKYRKVRRQGICQNETYAVRRMSRTYYHIIQGAALAGTMGGVFVNLQSNKLTKK